MCIYMYTPVYYIHICVYIHTYVYVYVYIYIYIHTCIISRLLRAIPEMVAIPRSPRSYIALYYIYILVYFI